jgi:hypothetical protein
LGLYLWWNFCAWGKVTEFFTKTIYPFITGIKNKISPSLQVECGTVLRTGLAAVINFIITGLNKVIDGINLLIRGANAVKIGKDIKELANPSS